LARMVMKPMIQTSDCTAPEIQQTLNIAECQ
jgi:hypothetical protein